MSGLPSSPLTVHATQTDSLWSSVVTHCARLIGQISGALYRNMSPRYTGGVWPMQPTGRDGFLLHAPGNDQRRGLQNPCTRSYALYLPTETFAPMETKKDVRYDSSYPSGDDSLSAV